MKTAISIPDDVFKKAEKLAKRKHKTHSQLYSDAVREYVLRHFDDEITETMNKAVDELGDEAKDPFVSAAARRIIERVEW